MKIAGIDDAFKKRKGFMNILIISMQRGKRSNPIFKTKIDFEYQNDKYERNMNLDVNSV